jgi:hypothetical protein
LQNSGQGLDTWIPILFLPASSGACPATPDGAAFSVMAIKLAIKTVEARMNRTGAMTYILRLLSHA